MIADFSILKLILLSLGTDGSMSLEFLVVESNVGWLQLVYIPTEDNVTVIQYEQRF